MSAVTAVTPGYFRTRYACCCMAATSRGPIRRRDVDCESGRGQKFWPERTRSESALRSGTRDTLGLEVVGVVGDCASRAITTDPPPDDLHVVSGCDERRAWYVRRRARQCHRQWHWQYHWRQRRRVARRHDQAGAARDRSDAAAVRRRARCAISSINRSASHGSTRRCSRSSPAVALRARRRLASTASCRSPSPSALRRSAFAWRSARNRATSCDSCCAKAPARRARRRARRWRRRGRRLR